jgi:hypothetical protein
MKTPRHPNPDNLPRVFCIAIESSADTPEIFHDKQPVGEICAHVCQGTHCLPAITDINEFRAYLDGMTHDQSPVP